MGPFSVPCISSVGLYGNFGTSPLLVLAFLFTMLANDLIISLSLIPEPLRVLTEYAQGFVSHTRTPQGTY